MTTTGVSNKTCAACKYLRRKCREECILAPHFPADQPKQFENARNLFGVSKMEKMLAAVHPLQRRDLARSIIYESDMRAKYPSLGCFGVILRLQQEIQRTEQLIALRKAELGLQESGPDLVLPPQPSMEDPLRIELALQEGHDEVDDFLRIPEDSLLPSVNREGSL